MRSRLLSSGKIITSLPPATCCSRCVCVHMCVCVSALCLEQFCFREAHTVFNFTPWDMMIWDNGWGSEDKAFCVSSCQMFKCDLKGDWFSWWEATLGALQRSEVDEQTILHSGTIMDLKLWWVLASWLWHSTSRVCRGAASPSVHQCWKISMRFTWDQGYSSEGVSGAQPGVQFARER